MKLLRSHKIKNHVGVTTCDERDIGNDEMSPSTTTQNAVISPKQQSPDTNTERAKKRLFPLSSGVNDYEQVLRKDNNAKMMRCDEGTTSLAVVSNDNPTVINVPSEQANLASLSESRTSENNTTRTPDGPGLGVTDTDIEEIGDTMITSVQGVVNVTTRTPQTPRTQQRVDSITRQTEKARSLFGQSQLSTSLSEADFEITLTPLEFGDNEPDPEPEVDNSEEPYDSLSDIQITNVHTVGTTPKSTPQKGEPRPSHVLPGAIGSAQPVLTPPHTPPQGQATHTQAHVHVIQPIPEDTETPQPGTSSPALNTSPPQVSDTIATPQNILTIPMTNPPLQNITLPGVQVMNPGAAAQNILIWNQIQGAVSQIPQVYQLGLVVPQQLPPLAPKPFPNIAQAGSQPFPNLAQAGCQAFPNIAQASNQVFPNLAQAPSLSMDRSDPTPPEANFTDPTDPEFEEGSPTGLNVKFLKPDPNDPLPEPVQCMWSYPPGSQPCEQQFNSMQKILDHLRIAHLSTQKARRGENNSIAI